MFDPKTGVLKTFGPSHVFDKIRSVTPTLKTSR